MADTSKITQDILEKLKAYEHKQAPSSTGIVKTIADGVAIISGLSDIGYSEMVEFSSGVLGVAINLEEDQVGVIVLGDYLGIQEGDEVKATGRVLSIGVGDELIGRVIDPVGNPLDGKGSIKTKKFNPVEKLAPSVTVREPVTVPLQTGVVAVDSMIPIGRGQRELIIGDRGVGKTAIAIDTIINQKGTGVICIYVAIGQKASQIAQLVNMLEQHGAMEHTIIVTANASDPAALQYIAPYAGCAVGEYFLEQGRDALVVYDDLSKHAWAYRQISLVLRRPSGREAYPGDIFYLHSKLLERACRVDADHGGGSLSALPIIETLAGDVSAYIPTNVISITDGQIYLEPDLFYAGVRPAINVGISVSRVGSAAQTKSMKQVAGQLRLDLAQYRALAAFSQLSSDLDPKTKSQLERGARMVELLKQKQYSPIPLENQVVMLFAGAHGFLDDVEISRIGEFKDRFVEYMETSHKKLLGSIAKEKKITDEAIEELKKAIKEFKKGF